VDLEDVCGDPADLIGVPILAATEESSGEVPEMTRRHDEFEDWTFYRISTIRGTVVLRWYGTSNGCYSVDVSINKL
jgi:hypothetical protein